MNHLFGAHTSTSGGVSKAIERAEKLNFTAIQIFTKNNNRWNAKPLEEKEIVTFKTNLINSKIEFVVSHDSYLINLCASNLEILNKSRIAFIDELERCELLGIPYLNFHPGSHTGRGELDGLKVIAESINIAHEKTLNYNVSSMLEITAGQGTTLGYKFEHINKIIEQVEEIDRISVCIDTAHMFAAGYDFRTEEQYYNTMKEFDSIIGLEYLKCFHINDSKKELGSRVDRHEHIGNGFIGLEAFANLINDERLITVPKILETPKSKEQLEDLENLEVLRNLIIHK
jgi:deoxyribonuclease IV